jgi:hypothetical protein
MSHLAVPVQLALRGTLVPLSEPVGSTTVENLISGGVFLNSEVNMIEVTYIVARLSIMLLRAFCADGSGGMLNKAKADLVKCIKETALQNDLRFEWYDMELFHAHCEVLVRLVGFTGRKSLAEFYSRDNT